VIHALLLLSIVILVSFFVDARNVVRRRQLNVSLGWDFEGTENGAPF
jgi:hypothetical protein